jgi:hypothetical protein
LKISYPSLIVGNRWDVPAFISMAIEGDDWNPLSEDGGMVSEGSWDQRMTKSAWAGARKLEKD